MDFLAGLLDGPRARGAFLIRSIFEPPWSLRIEDGSPLTLVAVVEGEAWITYDRDGAHDGAGAEPIRVRRGDVAIARGTSHYVLADGPDRPPQWTIQPGQRCTTLHGADLAVAMNLGIRTWGNCQDGSTVLLTGTYEEVGEIGQRLLDALPTLLRLGADELDSPVVALLADEIVKDEPGQEAVLDRLLDLLLISVLRTWFSRPEAEAPAWYRANSDPIVGKALRTLHNNPAHPWTVGSLASSIGVSRATLARRFTELVGEPPMSFLTGWRLALAADLLREPDTTVGAVARQVGYSTPFALSTAFKRFHGVSPQQHRVGAGVG
jgi:AraC-like DNA-binding protein